MELFIQRNIIYTIYTKGLLCISSLLLFISIEILHVHAPINTGLQDGLKHDPCFNHLCVSFVFIPSFWYNQSGQSIWEIFSLFSSISFPIHSVYRFPSCINLHGKRLYLNKFCIILHRVNVSSLFCQWTVNEFCQHFWIASTSDRAQGLGIMLNINMPVPIPGPLKWYQ